MHLQDVPDESALHFHQLASQLVENVPDDINWDYMD